MIKQTIRLVLICHIFFLLLLPDATCIAQRKNIEDFKQTDFLPTLEHPLTKGRNGIYSASFLYSWNAVRQQLNCSLSIQPTLKDLVLINQSYAYANSLKEDEVESNVTISENLISVRATFQKSLPFSSELYNGHTLHFNSEKVSSFEWIGHPTDVIDILYYNNDNDFVLKLSPQDSTHEIILLMSENRFETLSGFVNDVEKKIKLGVKEKTLEKQKWKYSFTLDDFIEVPKLAFDLEAHYKTIEGNVVSCDATNYNIGTASQSIAFYLNEKGAQIDSDGVTEIVFAEPVVDASAPKLMRFDKPFFLMLRRTDSVNPYFCTWVANTELMEKE